MRRRDSAEGAMRAWGVRGLSFGAEGWGGGEDWMGERERVGPMPLTRRAGLVVVGGRGREMVG